jgi:periplasmic divalent cation tolerance protein
MENAIVVLCTFPDIEQARQIGAALVERQVAACVNLLPGVESIYRWEGKVEKAGEVLGIIKTTRYDELEAAIQELHPYEVPEILALPVAGGASAYLKWLAASCSAD